MALSTIQLKSISFGYITGQNLIKYSSPELLIKQYTVDSGSLQEGVNTAYDEVTAELARKYNVATELAKIAYIPAMLLTVVEAGVVTGVTIINGGASYTEAPEIEFGGPGNGALATAVITDGVITSVIVSDGGTGYTTAPVINLTGGVPIDTRAGLLVKIVSILAVRNILANLQGLAEPMMLIFKWADKKLVEIRNGQSNLPLNSPALPDPGNEDSSVQSIAKLVNNSFSTIG